VGHVRAVKSVAVTPDGRLAFSASDDQTVRVWNLANGTAIALFSADAQLSACAAAPDGATIVAGDAVGRVYFLRLEGLDQTPR
jgi:WD40 repeat protein